MAKDKIVKAQLSKEELIALRLYTGCVCACACVCVCACACVRACVCSHARRRSSSSSASIPVVCVCARARVCVCVCAAGELIALRLYIVDMYVCLCVSLCNGVHRPGQAPSGGSCGAGALMHGCMDAWMDGCCSRCSIRRHANMRFRILCHIPLSHSSVTFLCHIPLSYSSWQGLCLSNTTGVYASSAAVAKAA